MLCECIIVISLFKVMDSGLCAAPTSGARWGGFPMIDDRRQETIIKATTEQTTLPCERAAKERLQAVDKKMTKVASTLG
jgi:hypothetical protein